MGTGELERSGWMGGVSGAVGEQWAVVATFACGVVGARWLLFAWAQDPPKCEGYDCEDDEDFHGCLSVMVKPAWRRWFQKVG